MSAIKMEDMYYNRFSAILTPSQIICLSNYINGLTIEMKSFSVLGLSDLLSISYDQMDYFISRSKWDERKMNRERVVQDFTLSTDKQFDIVLDESAMLKHTLQPHFISRGWIGNIGKVDKCLSNIHCNFVSDNENIPFELTTYLPSCKLVGGKKDIEFRGKHDIFLDLAMRGFFMAQEVGVQIRYLIFDSWFASARVLELLNKGVQKYFTEIRGTRNVKVGDCYVRAKDLVKVQEQEPKQLIHKGKSFSVTSTVTYLKDMNHPVKVFIVTGKLRVKYETRIFITNDLSTSCEEVFDLVNRRWQIEYCFREIKTNFGFDQAKFQKLLCYRRHFYICFLVWSINRQNIKSAIVETAFQLVRYRTKEKLRILT